MSSIIKQPADNGRIEISSNRDKERTSALADQEYSRENSTVINKYLSVVN